MAEEEGSGVSNRLEFHGIPFIVVVGRSISIVGSDEETGKARSGGEAVENRRAGGASGQRPPRSLLPSRDKHARHSRKRGAIEPLALISRLRDRFRPVFYLVQWIGSVYRSAILRLGWVN